MNPLHALLAFSLAVAPILRIERVLTDSFTFKAYDGWLDSNIGNVMVSTPAMEREFLKGTLVATDPDGDDLIYSIVSQPAHGAVSLDDALAGTFTYTPEFDVLVTILGYNPSATYHVQRSLDLRTWSDIPFIPNAAGTFVDRRTSGSQFYRVSFALPMQTGRERVRTIPQP